MRCTSPGVRIAASVVATLTAVAVLAGPLGAVGTASAGTDISGCTTIGSSGVYNLTTDISDSSESTCIEITASDVILDGGGHRVDGTDTFETTGIEVNGTSSTNLTNVTVRDITVTDWDSGINYNDAEGASVVAANLSANDDDGMVVEYTAQNTTIEDTIATGNSDEGFVIEGNGVTMSNVTTTNNNGAGVIFDDRPILNSDSLGLEATLDDVNASANGFVGIKIGGDDTGLPGSNFTNITAIANDDDGLELDSSNVTLRNALVVRNSRRGVSVDGHDVVHANVTAFANGGDDVKTDEGGSARDVVVDNATANDTRVYFENEDRVILIEVTSPPSPASPPNRFATDRYLEIDNRGSSDTSDVNLSTTYTKCVAPCWLPDLWRYNSSSGSWEQLPAAEISPGATTTQDISYDDGQILYNVTNAESGVHGLFLPSDFDDTSSQPDGSISISPSSPSPGESVTFDASSFNDSDTSVNGYSWRFGDGTSGNGSKPSHTYSSEGTYNVTLFLDTASGIWLVETSVDVSSSTATPTPTTVSTRTEGPGFGLTVALVGVLLALALATRRDR